MAKKIYDAIVEKIKQLKGDKKETELKEKVTANMIVTEGASLKKIEVTDIDTLGKAYHDSCAKINNSLKAFQSKQLPFVQKAKAHIENLEKESVKESYIARYLDKVVVE